MAADIFLKLGEIKGESVDAKHKDEIEVLSWKWGMSQSATTHMGTGGGAGKAKVRDLIITKRIDKASPNLQVFCCTGKHFDKAELVTRKAGDQPLEYLKITMKDVIIADVDISIQGGAEQSIERITLNFAEFSTEYIPQKADGSGDASIAHGFNIAKNTRV